MRVAVSTASVVRKVCAEGALRSFMSQGRESMPPVLTADRRGALESVVADGVARVMTELFPRVSGYRREGDVHVLEMSVSECAAGRDTVGMIVESAVTGYVLGVVYADIDRGFAECRREGAERSLSDLRERIDDASAGEVPECVRFSGL